MWSKCSHQPYGENIFRVPGWIHDLGTFGMYPICYWQVSGGYLQPEPTMYSRCFCWFPGPLTPSVSIWAGLSRPSADHWFLPLIKLNYKLVLSRWCCTKDANHVHEQSPPHPKFKLVHKINNEHLWHIDTITKTFAECILVRVWWVTKRSFECAR